MQTQDKMKLNKNSSMKIADQYNRLMAFIFLKQTVVHYQSCYREDIAEYGEALVRQCVAEGQGDRAVRLFTEKQLPKLVKRYSQICKDNLDKMAAFERSFERRMNDEQIELADEMSCDIGDIVRDILSTGAFKEVRSVLDKVKKQDVKASKPVRKKRIPKSKYIQLSLFDENL